MLGVIRKLYQGVWCQKESCKNLGLTLGIAKEFDATDFGFVHRRD